MLDTEIERSEWRGHPCSLLIAEMDNLGPLLAREDGQAIDESLKRFAHALRNETRPGDVMGRTAPLELAVIMPETGIPEAVEVGQEILSTVGRHYTISAGVACFPVHAANPKGLLDRAREALEAAKSQGGNAVVHLDDALPGVRGLRPIR
jgi:diguanylate cyclase (GGDEF)-like protein